MILCSCARQGVGVGKLDDTRPFAHPLARASTPRRCARQGVGVGKLDDTRPFAHPLARASTPRRCARQGVGVGKFDAQDHSPPAGAGSYTPSLRPPGRGGWGVRGSKSLHELHTWAVMVTIACRRAATIFSSSDSVAASGGMSTRVSTTGRVRRPCWRASRQVFTPISFSGA